MQIKLLVAIAGPDLTAPAGSLVDAPDAKAEMLIREGYAVKVQIAENKIAEVEAAPTAEALAKAVPAAQTAPADFKRDQPLLAKKK